MVGQPAGLSAQLLLLLVLLLCSSPLSFTSDCYTMADAPFPATTKRTAGEIKGVLTDVMTVGFADKIVVTIVQNGRLAQWVCWPCSLRYLSLWAFAHLCHNKD